MRNSLPKNLPPPVLITAAFTTAALLAVLCENAAGAERSVTHDLGDRRELFVDQYLIESLSGSARLRLHQPREAEIAFHFDAPWEGPLSTYATVFRDGDLFRLYYRGYWTAPEQSDPLTGVTKTTTRDGLQFACYAESRDGKTFTRPTLGLHEFQGSKENNIVWPHRAHNFTPFKDERPGVPEDELYKALMTRGSLPGVEGSGLSALYSADGIHWRLAGSRAVQGGGGFDSQNVAFWDATRQEYRSYSRMFEDKIRGFGWARSDDFQTWTLRTAVVLDEGPREHLYTNATLPYFRAPHFYFSFPKRLVTHRQGREGQQGISDALFLSSRDGMRFDQTFREALIPPGRDPLNWGDRGTMPAWGLVETGDDEMSLYYTQHYRQASAHLRRGAWRLDGIASLRADGAEGELLTRPLSFSGNTLRLNYATSAAGSIRVEIQNAEGEALPGFRLAEAGEIFGDEIDGAVAWKAGADVSSLAGKAIRLRFVLRDADVFSFRFGEG